MDPNPTDLRDVISVFIGDSLYVAASLLSDPSPIRDGEFDPRSSDIRRVAGNIGRAGLAFLIPPRDPIVRRPDPEKWSVVNHNKFDGKLENNFASTTLHLSFTGYEVPMAREEHSGRFIDAFFIEAVVSVHDNGDWIADLDVLRSLRSEDLDAVDQESECKASSPVGHLPSREVVSIDNWEELLDAHSDLAVVRAHGNWQARLAAAAVSVQLGHPTLLFKGHGCWTCALQKLQNWQKVRKEWSEDQKYEYFVLDIVPEAAENQDEYVFIL